MESKTFSTNSFIYRFLAWPGSYLPSYRRPEDICELRQAVITKAFLGSLAVFLLFFYTCSMTSFGLFTLAKHFIFFSAYATESILVRFGRAFSVLTLSISAVALVVYCVVNAIVRIQAYLRKRRKVRDEAGLKPLLDPVTSPIKEMYQSWKDKLCYRVKFE